MRMSPWLVENWQRHKLAASRAWNHLSHSVVGIFNVLPAVRTFAFKKITHAEIGLILADSFISSIQIHA